MLYSLYCCDYCLKNKYRPHIFIDNLGKRQYFYPSDNYLKAHNHREYYYFTPWKKIAWNFSLDYKGIEWLRKNVLPRSDFKKDYFMTDESDWYPLNHLLEIDMTIYKVEDENGNIVNMSNVIHNHHEEWKKHCELNHQKWKEAMDVAPSYRYYLRHPHTTQEKRMKLTPQEKREFIYEGIHIKERGKRSPRNLPHLYDDKPINYSKSWKFCTKQPKQNLIKCKGKRKKVFGEFKRYFNS